MRRDTRCMLRPRTGALRQRWCPPGDANQKAWTFLRQAAGAETRTGPNEIGCAATPGACCARGRARSDNVGARRVMQTKKHGLSCGRRPGLKRAPAPMKSDAPRHPVHAAPEDGRAPTTLVPAVTDA